MTWHQKSPTQQTAIRRNISSTYSIKVDNNRKWHGQITDFIGANKIRQLLPKKTFNQEYIPGKHYITKKYCAAFTQIEQFLWESYYNNQNTNKETNIKILLLHNTNPTHHHPTCTITYGSPTKTINLNNMTWPSQQKLIITALIFI